MSFPDEITLFGKKGKYDLNTRSWHVYFFEVGIRAEFKEIVDFDFFDMDEPMIHCDVFHYDELVAIGIGNDFHFAAIDAKLHKRLDACIQVFKELSEIKNLAFNH